MNETPSPSKRISFFFIAIISVLLVLSAISLWHSIETYRTKGSFDLMTVILSVSAIALSSYVFLQTRRKPLDLGFELPKVFTSIECSGCQFKDIREFQKGDYILKDAGSCPKCTGQMMISAIYKEAEKEK